MRFSNDSMHYGALMISQREQFLDWTVRGQPGGDLEMYGITIALNRITGVVTRFCCESHPKKRGTDQFYVMMLATPEGQQHLNAIYTRTFKRWFGGWNNKALQFITATNAFPITPGPTLHAVPVQTSIFEVYLSRKNKYQFLQIFQRTIEEYADEMGFQQLESTQRYKNAVRRRDAARLG